MTRTFSDPTITRSNFTSQQVRVGSAQFMVLIPTPGFSEMFFQRRGIDKYETRPSAGIDDSSPSDINGFSYPGLDSMGFRDEKKPILNEICWPLQWGRHSDMFFLINNYDVASGNVLEDIDRLLIPANYDSIRLELSSTLRVDDLVFRDLFRIRPSEQTTFALPANGNIESYQRVVKQSPRLAHFVIRLSDVRYNHRSRTVQGASILGDQDAITNNGSWFQDTSNGYEPPHIDNNTYNTFLDPNVVGGKHVGTVVDAQNWVSGRVSFPWIDRTYQTRNYNIQVFSIPAAGKGINQQSGLSSYSLTQVEGNNWQSEFIRNRVTIRMEYLQRISGMLDGTSTVTGTTPSDGNVVDLKTCLSRNIAKASVSGVPTWTSGSADVSESTIQAYIDQVVQPSYQYMKNVEGHGQTYVVRELGLASSLAEAQFITAMSSGNIPLAETMYIRYLGEGLADWDSLPQDYALIDLVTYDFSKLPRQFPAAYGGGDTPHDYTWVDDGRRFLGRAKVDTYHGSNEATILWDANSYFGPGPENMLSRKSRCYIADEIMALFTPDTDIEGQYAYVERFNGTSEFFANNIGCP